jgi:hypothetical protein
LTFFIRICLLLRFLNGILLTKNEGSDEKSQGEESPSPVQAQDQLPTSKSSVEEDPSKIDGLPSPRPSESVSVREDRRKLELEEQAPVQSDSISDTENQRRLDS